MPNGKYFVIRSRMNGKVIDIEGGDANPAPGTPCIMYDQKDSGENDNQLFFECPLSDTIRCKINPDLCLDVDTENNGLIVNPVRHGDRDQAWDRTDDMVVNRQTGKALDIEGADDSNGARVLSWDIHGESNQKWDFDYIEPRYFFVVSQMNGKVMDVEGADPAPGTKVVMWAKKDEPEDNQLFYEGENGFIRSKLNDYVLDTEGGAMTLQPYEPGKPSQRFCLDCRSDTIMCADDQGKCLDIEGAKDDDGANILNWDFHGGNNQKWRFEFI